MKTVLIVDDERLIRWSLAEGLKDRYRVRTAATVDEALAMLPVDVLVTDLKMPGRSGMELVAHVRGHHPETKVFVITAHGSDDDLQRCFDLDVEGYIRKPFEIAMVRDMIAMHLAWPHARTG